MSRNLIERIDTKAGDPATSSWLEEVAVELLSSDAADSFIQSQLSRERRANHEFRAVMKTLTVPHLGKGLQKIAAELGFLIPWPNNEEVRLGEIVSYPQGVALAHIQQLNDLDIQFDVEKSGAELPVPADIVFASGSVNSSQRNDRLRLEFSEPDSMVFIASGFETERIEDLSRLLDEKVLPLVDQERWKPEWFLVTEVLSAAYMLVVVASSASAFVEFSQGIRIDDQTGVLALSPELGRRSIEAQSDVEIVRMSTPAEGTSAQLFTAMRHKRGLIDVIRGRTGSFVKASSYSLKSSLLFET